jgi:hypothetical protein
MSRLTARRSSEDWAALREEAILHLQFSMHLMWFQNEAGHGASFEQPEHCGSWQTPYWPALQQVGFEKTGFDMCVYGLVDEHGAPLKKSGGIAANRPLDGLCWRCTCQQEHGVVEGSVSVGPDKGKRRSEVAARYPEQLCVAWARLIFRAVR